MLSRRIFLKTWSRVPLLGAMFGTGIVTAPLLKGDESDQNSLPRRDIYKELGVPTFINASEPFTALSGGPVRPEVRAAMRSTETQYVRLDDVQNAVGQRLASLLGAGGVMVTAGAASGLTLGTAACLTGSDLSRVKRLPDTSAMPNEVIIQKAHRYPYEHAVRNCGAIMVEVETADQMLNAISSKTACLLFNNRWNPNGMIKHEQFIAIGKKAGIPTFNDCASDAPPAENLTQFTKMGFDLVTFSGGKGLHAPASTGLLIGRKDLIEAAKLNSEAHSNNVGRNMKVNKEEMIGIMVAVELCLQEGHDPFYIKSADILGTISRGLSSVSGLKMEMFEPPVSYRSPHLRILWDENKHGLSADKARELLIKGSPSIETRDGPDPTRGLELTAWMLSPQDVPIVIQRIKALFT